MPKTFSNSGMAVSTCCLVLMSKKSLVRKPVSRKIAIKLVTKENLALCIEAPTYNKSG